MPVLSRQIIIPVSQSQVSPDSDPDLPTRFVYRKGENPRTNGLLYLAPDRRKRPELSRADEEFPTCIFWQRAQAVTKNGFSTALKYGRLPPDLLIHRPISCDQLIPVKQELTWSTLHPVGPAQRFH
jgi:hypothetical protein